MSLTRTVDAPRMLGLDRCARSSARRYARSQVKAVAALDPAAVGDPDAALDPAAVGDRDVARASYASVPPPALRLGPLLRHVGSTDATLWVETTRSALVEVCAGSLHAAERTFQVAGHHYALVIIEGLEPGSRTPYEVRLDGRAVWPTPDSPYPPSVIATIDPAAPFRLLFGSCRSPLAVADDRKGRSGDDVLAAYARSLVHRHRADWPSALLMLGDQVYADETSAETQAYIRTRRDARRPPYLQVADFEEYTRLYAEAWTDPDVRWLLSTIPSSMIFDDHDVLDDWNTSRSWRAEMGTKPWWSERITGALMSYWIYQHLGNLSPDGLRSDELYGRIRAASDGETLLRDFARAADREADGGPAAMWSYRRDFGNVRLLVIDSRAGRVLTEGARLMVGEPESAWIERQVEDGPFEHLLIGTSVPWLLPRALHDVEALDEDICSGRHGRPAAWLGERLRRAVDLEHWAAFRESFDRLARLIGRVARGEHGAPAPSTICVLSGDVHHTYASEAVYPDPIASRVFQLTCSPLHNTIPRPMRLVFTASWSRLAQRLVGALTRAVGVPAVSIDWRTSAGPFYGNLLGQLDLAGPSAVFSLHHAQYDGSVARAALVPDGTWALAAPIAALETQGVAS